MTEQRIPTLSQWAEERLRNMFNAKTEADFDSAFDAFLSPQATITLNNTRVSREAYKRRLSGETSGDVAPATFNVAGVLEVPDSEEDPTGRGAVGLFFEATLFGRFFVLGARTSSTIRSSLNVEIGEDRTMRGGDARRVMNLNEISMDHRNPIMPKTSK